MDRISENLLQSNDPAGTRQLRAVVLGQNTKTALLNQEGQPTTRNAETQQEDFDSESKTHSKQGTLEEDTHQQLKSTALIKIDAMASRQAPSEFSMTQGKEQRTDATPASYLNQPRLKYGREDEPSTHEKESAISDLNPYQIEALTRENKGGISTKELIKLDQKVRLVEKRTKKAANRYVPVVKPVDTF